MYLLALAGSSRIWVGGRDQVLRTWKCDSLLLVGVHGLLEGNAELLADRLELLKVLLVLVLVLNLELDTYWAC
jgi:hypothetical protein